MNCQRCRVLGGGIAVARIRTDIIDLKICARCAEEARDLDMVLEPLDGEAVPATTPVGARAPKKIAVKL